MISKIATLSAKLREKDLPVSIRSTQAAVEIYMKLGEEDRNLLKTALMAVYVKDRYDIPKFNKVFDEVFTVELPKKENGELNRGMAYRGAGPKSNKYVIKKQSNMASKVRKEKINNEKLKMLSGQPLLDEVKKLERDGELMNQDLTKLNRFACSTSFSAFTVDRHFLSVAQSS